MMWSIFFFFFKSIFLVLLVWLVILCQLPHNSWTRNQKIFTILLVTAIKVTERVGYSNLNLLHLVVDHWLIDDDWLWFFLTLFAFL